ncbi:immunoglobulin-like domain-containing protein [Thermococcus pacificus]|uniref:Bacterial Ig-like domain-containing protein n=1 Tax=Thermococcus pacificus TaxID=71998 RepID=A0A218P8Z3_9EURY|nr:immunoglobulin-like domain-containing protein [Thermococcus pacificus]ASJ07252.1 hypothetical protein A3L08_07925 [Thermococcus pacificus]
MRKVIPVLLIILLVPVGYYFASYWGSPADGSSGGKDLTHTSPDSGLGTETLLKLDKTVYSPNDTMLITITNKGDGNITTGYAFRLYRLENGTWNEVPVNLVFIEVAVVIEPGKSWEQKVNLADLKLDQGHYRIVKTVSVTDPVTKMALA